MRTETACLNVGGYSDCSIYGRSERGGRTPPVSEHLCLTHGTYGTYGRLQRI